MRELRDTVMGLGNLGRVPIEALVDRALERVSQGEPPARAEVERVDFKEERGRRGRDGSIFAGRNDQ